VVIQIVRGIDIGLLKFEYHRVIILFDRLKSKGLHRVMVL